MCEIAHLYLVVSVSWFDGYICLGERPFGVVLPHCHGQEFQGYFRDDARPFRDTRLSVATNQRMFGYCAKVDSILWLFEPLYSVDIKHYGDKSPDYESTIGFLTGDVIKCR